MSLKDTRAQLDNGNFDRFFDLLKKDRDYWQLCVFLGMCMGIEVTITKKQLGYVKRVWKEVDPTQCSTASHRSSSHSMSTRVVSHTA